jgi:tRNA threonylcarbamoyladenosine biosynthesis protein TsaE
MSRAALVATTTSAAETQALAAALAGCAQPGDLVVLAGEMGAGKTAFAQGFARGLGIDDTVTSPTFTIVREYSGGRLALHHLDVYRLEHLREVTDLGLGEMLDEPAVMLVEWGDAVLPALGDQYLEVRIAFGAGDDDRRLELRGVGGSWPARRRVLAEAMAPWGQDAEGSEPC